MVRRLMFTALLALPLVSHGQGLTPHQLIDRFSETLSTSDFEDATTALLQQNEALEYAAYDLAHWRMMFKDEFGPKVSALGKFQGMELIREREYAPSFKRAVYLHKMEGGFVFWHMTFYRAPGGWVISGIEVTNDPKQLSGYLKEIE